MYCWDSSHYPSIIPSHVRKHCRNEWQTFTCNAALSQWQTVMCELTLIQWHIVTCGETLTQWHTVTRVGTQIQWHIVTCGETLAQWHIAIRVGTLILWHLFTCGETLTLWHIVTRVRTLISDILPHVGKSWPSYTPWHVRTLIQWRIVTSKLHKSSNEKKSATCGSYLAGVKIQKYAPRNSYVLWRLQKHFTIFEGYWLSRTLSKWVNYM